MKPSADDPLLGLADSGDEFVQYAANLAGARMMRMRQLLVGQVVSHLAQQPDELVCGHGSWYPQKPFSFATTWMAARDDRAVVVGGWKRLEIALMEPPGDL